MSELISVIIPTFNRSHILTKAIESVTSQSNENWELIIVDDGSTDDTQEKVEEFLTDRRIKYFFQQNSGVSVARNAGVDRSSGEYLIFLDSDDTFHPDLIQQLNNERFHRYDIICWEVMRIFDGKSIIEKPKKLKKIYNSIMASFLAGSICYKKEIFLQVGKYDSALSFGENYELGMRISEVKDLRIKIINEPLLTYNVSNPRVSNSISNRYSSYLHLHQKHKKKFIADPISFSNMNYLLGYVHEKKGLVRKAKGYYKTAFISSPWNYKAFLKFIYFNLFFK